MGRIKRRWVTTIWTWRWGYDPSTEIIIRIRLTNRKRTIKIVRLNEKIIRRVIWKIAQVVTRIWRKIEKIIRGIRKKEIRRIEKAIIDLEKVKRYGSIIS